MHRKIERGERKAKRSQIPIMAKLFEIDEKELLAILLADMILDTVENEDEIKGSFDNDGHLHKGMPLCWDIQPFQGINDPVGGRLPKAGASSHPWREYPEANRPRRGHTKQPLPSPPLKGRG